MLIDKEIKSLMDKTYKNAQGIIKGHISELHLLAQALLDRETLTGDEITKVLNGEPLEQKIDSKGDEKLCKIRKKTKMPTQIEE